MTAPVHQVLTQFDRLSAEEKQEAASEILRRISELDFPPLRDQTLDQIADEVFLRLDAEESANGDA